MKKNRSIKLLSFFVIGTFLFSMTSFGQEPVHHHQWPSVLYIQAAGDFIDYDGEGKVIFDTRTLPAPHAFPMTMYKEPEAPYAVENLSKTITIKLIRVAVKQ